jgi:hypothetical protein
MFHAFRSAGQARRSDGHHSTALLRDANRVFWTRTMWRDEQAMRTFMTTGAHRKAMPKLLHWCDEAAVVHWTQDSAERPSWIEAHRRLAAEGRPSKVNHPSAAHVAFDIPPVQA